MRDLKTYSHTYCEFKTIKIFNYFSQFAMKASHFPPHFSLTSISLQEELWGWDSSSVGHTVPVLASDGRSLPQPSKLQRRQSRREARGSPRRPSEAQRPGKGDTERDARPACLSHVSQRRGEQTSYPGACPWPRIKPRTLCAPLSHTGQGEQNS